MAGASNPDNISDILSGFSEGRLNLRDRVVIPEPEPHFIKMIVMDVISDPTADCVDEVKITKWHSMKVSNWGLHAALPRNTIIAKKVGENSQPMFVFPFFPSHLSLPCKAGEAVWVLIERPNAKSLEIAYWFCRVVEYHTTDDVNHSHPGRSFEITMNEGLVDRAKNEKEGTAATGENVWHELRNGPVLKVDGERVTSPQGQILPGENPDVFEKLLTGSYAAAYTFYESVPRFRKRPGDVALEGSNNSLIVLGTDRKSAIASALGEWTGSAGCIDMVAGRGYTKDTSGISATTTSFVDAGPDKKGTILKKELNKSFDVLTKSEGDLDMMNDRSRMLISQKTSVDGKTGLSSYNAAFNKGGSPATITDDAKGDAAIVIKSDKLRLIARSDLQLLVTNYKASTDPDFPDRKDEESDTDKWASITIKTNGDVVFRPSKEGYIKLGGDDADKGVVCSDVPVTATGGNVAGPPLVTTMGGFFAGSSVVGSDNKGALATGQAKFANKVLIK